MDPVSESPGIVRSAQAKTLRTNVKPKSLAGGAGATTLAKLFKIALGKSYLVTVTVVARDATAGHIAHYVVKASVANKAGTVALIGAATADHTAEDDNTWTATLIANDTDNTVDLQVTPDATNDTVFSAFAEAIEL